MLSCFAHLGQNISSFHATSKECTCNILALLIAHLCPFLLIYTIHQVTSLALNMQSFICYCLLCTAKSPPNSPTFLCSVDIAHLWPQDRLTSTSLPQLYRCLRGFYKVSFRRNVARTAEYSRTRWLLRWVVRSAPLPGPCYSTTPHLRKRTQISSRPCESINSPILEYLCTEGTGISRVDTG